MKKRAKTGSVFQPGRLKKIASVSLIALVLAGFSFTAAVGEVFERANPVLTKMIGLGNRAQADLNYTVLLAGTGKLQPTSQRLVDTAREAIAAQPLNPKALQVIALREFQANNKAESLSLARLTERISRREFGAHLLLFQDALLQNDLKMAFNQLDVGMRTAGDRRSLLYPSLTQGLKTPEFRQGLAPIIDEQGDWVSQFLVHAVDEGGAAVEVAQLFESLQPRTRELLVPTLAARTITRLTDAGQVSAARAMFAALPGKTLATLSDPGLTEATFDPEIGSLGWRLEEGATLTARVAQGRSEGSRAALIDVGPGDSAPALTRMLFMAPGAYTFSASARTDGSGSDVASQWTMRCVGSPAAPMNWNSRSRSSLVIPAGCPVQLLQLVVTQVGDSSYGQLLVEGVSIRRK